MSQEKAVYTVEPSVVTAATESEVNDRMNGELPPNSPTAQQVVNADEEAAQAEARQSEEAQVEAEPQVEAQEVEMQEAKIVGELQASVATLDAQIADLKAKLAEAEQRAALPPLAGNPATNATPVEAHGYDLIRKAIESGQTQFGF